MSELENKINDDLINELEGASTAAFKNYYKVITKNNKSYSAHDLNNTEINIKYIIELATEIQHRIMTAWCMICYTYVKSTERHTRILAPDPKTGDREMINVDVCPKCKKGWEK